MSYIENISFIKIEQPIGEFYVARMKCKDVLDIAKYDIRRIERDESNNIDSYFGIQRSPSPTRLKEISQYATYIDATFPTSIVVAIDSYDNIEAENPKRNIEERDNCLRIRRDEKVAQIIDGQHRLLGLQKAIESYDEFSEKIKEKFELPVTIYVDMDIADQSMVFATINKAQTKVNKSLVYDLYDLSNSRSPYKTAHNIVRVLNENNKSPLKDKIKMLGTAHDSLSETIAQATLVDCIVKYISREPMKDRDDIKRNNKLFYDETNLRYFFRKWFVESQDILIARTLVNYFSSIKNHWEDPWNSNTIIVKSTGIIAFMNFLQIIIKNIPTIDWTKEVSYDTFDEIIKKINISNGDFNNENYPAGGIGQQKLKRDLMERSQLD